MFWDFFYIAKKIDYVKNYLLIRTVLFFFLSTAVFSQDINLSSLLIPDELKKDANAVIRENIIEISLNKVDEIVVKEKRVVTVLNKVGNSEINTYAHYNNDTKITELSAKIYNALGKEIKKYSKSKFKDVSAVDGGSLYSDSRVKYIDYTPIAYPYTVVFESEYKNSSTGFIPRWFPTNGYYVSIQKSEYIVNNPLNLEIRTKEKNFKDYPIKNTSINSNLHYTFENQPAIKYESSSIPSRDFMPNLLVATNQFSLKKVKGNGANWQEFGKWMYDKLLLGRNQLDNATIAKAKSLVAGVNNEIEKAKILYKFMQDKTRYISVQVGIGGWEPIAANEVDKVGYGDCKGLTNYTKALFDAVGIKSHYTVVYAKNRRDIDKDFSSIQGNHVILNLPNNGNDIWLECTSQTMPFGFLGHFTDDRNVLVVTPEGGIIKRTPAYKNETNIQTTKATIKLNSEGSLTADLEIISKGIKYDNKFPIERKTKEELEKYYKSSVWNYNNNLEIISTELKTTKTKLFLPKK